MTENNHISVVSSFITFLNCNYLTRTRRLLRPSLYSPSDVTRDAAPSGGAAHRYIRHKRMYARWSSTAPPASWGYPTWQRALPTVMASQRTAPGHQEALTKVTMKPPLGPPRSPHEGYHGAPIRPTKKPSWAPIWSPRERHQEALTRDTMEPSLRPSRSPPWGTLWNPQ